MESIHLDPLLNRLISKFISKQQTTNRKKKTVHGKRRSNDSRTNEEQGGVTTGIQIKGRKRGEKSTQSQN